MDSKDSTPMKGKYLEREDGEIYPYVLHQCSL